VTSFIQSFGALGVFLLMVPESACIPIPSEVTLIFSGVAVHQGWMSFPLALLAATAGNLVGSLLAYGLGASGLLASVPVVDSVLGRWEA
jgi:membrane protein DedA with SNARE-associated domain